MKSCKCSDGATILTLSRPLGRTCAGPNLSTRTNILVEDVGGARLMDFLFAVCLFQDWCSVSSMMTFQVNERLSAVSVPWLLCLFLTSYSNWSNKVTRTMWVY